MRQFETDKNFDDVDSTAESMANQQGTLPEQDMLMEEILDNMNNTPLGQVLKRIASLPEVRQKKVLGVRRKLTGGDYELDDRLDDVLERVLDDLDE
jgi:hypothetical protein